MSDFTTLLPTSLPRAQKVAHEHVLEALRAFITDYTRLKSLIKRAGLKLEVLNDALSSADITTIENLSAGLRTNINSVETWVTDLEANYTGTALTLS